jgi:hypothetical protein
LSSSSIHNKWSSMYVPRYFIKTQVQTHHTRSEEKTSARTRNAMPITVGLFRQPIIRSNPTRSFGVDIQGHQYESIQEERCISTRVYFSRVVIHHPTHGLVLRRVFCKDALQRRYLNCKLEYGVTPPILVFNGGVHGFTRLDTNIRITTSVYRG